MEEERGIREVGSIASRQKTKYPPPKKTWEMGMYRGLERDNWNGKGGGKGGKGEETEVVGDRRGKVLAHELQHLGRVMFALHIQSVFSCNLELT